MITIQKPVVLIGLNEFAAHHNNLLQSELNRIQKENPTTKIIYADYYNVAMRFYRSPLEYGTTEH